MRPYILHIPHSSPYLPFSDGFVVGKQTLQDEINLLTDWFTDELFDLPYPKIVSPFSRVFCDVERFEDDAHEIMSQKGMGMCYTNMDNGEMMRVVDHDLRERIRSEYYIPHHQSLESLTTELLHKNGQVTIVDCHSFPDKPLNRDLNKDVPRPDFCLGIDDCHTPADLYKPVVEFLIKAGYTVLVNNPYSGTMIPMKYYKKNRNVTGLMIEVNRKLYMTTSYGAVIKTLSFGNIRRIINNIFQLLKND